MATNLYPGTCARCRTRVEAGEGTVSKGPGGWLTEHAKYGCPGKQKPVFTLPAIDAVAIPGTASTELFAHQAQVVAAVQRGQRKIYLADEPGLGKTAVAAISLAAAGSRRAVIVVPAVVKVNWGREIDRWTPGRKASTLATKTASPIDPATEIVIVNYDILAAHLPSILAWRPDALIADEAHYVKDKKAARTKVVAAIAEAVGGGLKMYLSGTPIPNRPIELAEPLKQLGMLEKFGGFWEFATHYCEATRTSFGWDMGGAANLGELNSKLLAAGMVRRLKADVLDLPERTVLDLPVALDAKAAGGVKTAQKAMVAKLVLAVKDFAKTQPLSYALIRRVVGGTLAGEAGFTELSALRRALGVAKISLTVAQAEDLLESGPVVVFAHHREVVDAIAAQLTEAGSKVGTIIGGQSASARQAVVDGFQQGTLDVVVASIEAAGLGITLHRANQVVVGELPWTASAQTQAIDRVHRIGQDSPVTAWRIIADDTLDGKLASTVARKASIAAQAIDGTEDDGAEDGEGVADVIAALVAKAMKVPIPA